MSHESALYKIADMKVFKNSNKISTVALYFCNAANWNGFSRTFLEVFRAALFQNTFWRDAPEIFKLTFLAVLHIHHRSHLRYLICPRKGK